MRQNDLPPFPSHEFVVPKEWCDYNEHFSDCFYLIPFSTALDLVLDTLGLGQRYRHANHFSTYTVESHLRYLREAKEHEQISITSRLKDADQKRLFTEHTMLRGNERIATCEFVCLHVDVTIPKVVLFPEAIAQRIAQSKA